MLHTLAYLAAGLSILLIVTGSIVAVSLTFLNRDVIVTDPDATLHATVDELDRAA